ncbi:MAG: SPFH domain-containing protein [Patescibacteria group bacterium]|nr:SPFH domain-containing protein [Patescibacteria group bacterium]
MKKVVVFFIIFCLSFNFLGCVDDIPQAHKGQIFNRTGFWALYIGGDGLSGPVLGPGTHYIGVYNNLSLVNCAQLTRFEEVTSLTRDGVRFSININTRYSANCSNDAIQKILSTLSPDRRDMIFHRNRRRDIITPEQIYLIFIQPTLWEALDEAVSPYSANDIKNKNNREKIMDKIKNRIREMMKKKPLARVWEINLHLSNMDFPDSIKQINIERATLSAVCFVRDRENANLSCQREK